MMERKKFMMDQPGASQQTVTIPQGHNRLVVHLQEHTWAAVLSGARLLVRNQSPNSVIAFTLKSGNYVVRTDGKIESMTTESFRQESSLLEQLRQGVPATLTVTSDAPDRHVVDGIGEIAADGA